MSVVREEGLHCRPLYPLTRRCLTQTVSCSRRCSLGVAYVGGVWPSLSGWVVCPGRPSGTAHSRGAGLPRLGLWCALACGVVSGSRGWCTTGLGRRRPSRGAAAYTSKRRCVIAITTWCRFSVVSCSRRCSGAGTSCWQLGRESPSLSTAVSRCFTSSHEWTRGASTTAGARALAVVDRVACVCSAWVGGRGLDGRRMRQRRMCMLVILLHPFHVSRGPALPGWLFIIEMWKACRFHRTYVNTRPSQALSDSRPRAVSSFSSSSRRISAVSPAIGDRIVGFTRALLCFSLCDSSP